MDSRFNFRGSGKKGTCFEICLKQLRKALEIQGTISDFDLFWTAVGSHNENFPANTFVPYRDSVEFQYRLSVGGKNVLLKARIAQENENKISGTAQFSEVSGPYIGTITLVAHRNTENGSGGGCNTGASPLFLLALLPIIFKLRK